MFRLHPSSFLCLLLLLVGCESARPPLGQWDGPQFLSTSSVESWNFGVEGGRKIRTPNYILHTTISDEETLAMLTQVMEGALTQYRKVAPIAENVKPRDGKNAAANSPMECYIFERRSEWEAYTKANTGPDAAIYLQIRRGGYAIGDKFYAQYIGRAGTASVSAHEGWHQYVARHFIGRLPPFVEEGLACMFEGIGLKDDTLPRWNLSINQIRVQALRRAAEAGHLWPLEKLVAMHAGQVVEENGEKVDAFYAQAWVFARFMYESENGRFRPALQAMLSETAAGTVWDPTGSHQKARGVWRPGAVRPMIEHYLNLDFATIDKLYKAYIRKVAFDEYSAQWNS